MPIERLANRNKTTVIFGRKITKQYRGKLQTVIEDMDLTHPVTRSRYGNGFVKQYVRDHLLLRIEPASNNVNDYRCKKAIENLPRLRENMSSVIDTYHNVQQDILETFIDRGQLRKLSQPTILLNGKRIPGLKLDHPRQLALMHALVRFSHIAAQSTFTTAEIYPDTLSALELSPQQYSLGSLRYDLSKLRAKAKVEAGVQVAQRWIVAALRHRKFFHLSDLNEAIGELLDRLNDRPSRKRPELSRTLLFEQLDRPALKPLPAERYVMAQWKPVKPNIDYHVEIERHYYSVPYQLVG